jgi:hypothetical protein
MNIEEFRGKVDVASVTIAVGHMSTVHTVFFLLGGCMSYVWGDEVS